MDLDSIGTGLAILGTAEVSKDAIQKILAPTADYIGAGVLQGSKATVNTVRVLAKAARRLGPRLEGNGQVPPRVLKGVLDEAPWIEDELMAEYLGGILASSFSDHTLDDRAVALLSTLRRLSSYSVRTHYLCYAKFYALQRGHIRWIKVYDDLENVGIANDLRTYGSHQSYAEFLGSPYPEDEYWSVHMHAFSSLDREELLTRTHLGDRVYLGRELSQEGIRYEVPNDGFVYRTTGAGDELFLWGLGRGELRIDAFPDVDLDYEIQGVDLPTGFERLEALRVD